MFKNLIWDFAGKLGGQIISFVISIVLTRLLSPAEYGIMGMSMAIIVFAHIFLDLGFNRALIQQPEVAEVQYSTVFFLNAGLAALLTLVCFFIGAPLSRFYNQPLIEPVFQVLSLNFLFNGLNLVPSALLYKRMHLKANSLISLVAALLSGIIGIGMAYKGYGVWSLVLQSLVNAALTLVLTFIYARWFPVWMFSFASIKSLWQYGSRMFASGLLDVFFTRLDTFIIGKLFLPNILGFYTRAQSMDNMVRQLTANSIMGAMFPYIAKHQHDRTYLKAIYTNYVHIILFASVGLSACLLLSAPDLFNILFTSKWHPAAEMFQIMSIAGFTWPVSSLMCNLIAGVGNSAAFFRLEVIKKIVFIPVYIFGFLLGIKGFIYFIVLASFIAVMLNAYYLSREIQMKLWSQLKIIAYYLITGGACCAAAYYLCLFLSLSNQFIHLFVLGITFTTLYVAFSFLLKLPGTSIINLSLNKLKLSSK